jgi:hypothetical protein
MAHEHQTEAHLQGQVYAKTKMFKTSNKKKRDSEDDNDNGYENIEYDEDSYHMTMNMIKTATI